MDVFSTCAQIEVLNEAFEQEGAGKTRSGGEAEMNLSYGMDG